ncbi:DUF4238 domain-containing protein [Methylobacter sp. BBA5.1]|uniref:DUF4238 domain-containing protein n=1 Tax=Methylobacter sp. BBA5.1 TaxID=1495064 RepID=UPI00126824B9|nr:DUF4238 domain-containing protein [Methylobacter sp. BBA5.1]
MISTVKKQHYVWEHYLDAWSINGKIWCKRNDSVFHTSTENVAQERYFYETEPLTENETTLLLRVINRFPPSSHLVHHSSLFSHLLTSEGNEKVRKNGIEHFHNIIEGKVVSIVNILREGNTSVLENKQNKIDFCIFLGQQYTRTKKIKNTTLKILESTRVPEEFRNCDFQKVFRVLSFLLANNIGYWIYEQAEIVILRNDTDKELITGDQPIYNLFAKNGEEINDVELYYPLSPKFALLATKNPRGRQSIDIESVAIYNRHILSIAHESIFFSKEESLQQLMSL